MRTTCRTAIPVLVVGLLLSWAAPTPAQTPDEARRAIESVQPEAGEDGLGALTLEQLLDSLGVPGASVAVISDGEVHWAAGYGVRDVETGAPVDTETVFQAASISKPVAAMASLKAVQEGLFDLDDDVNRILTSWRLDGEGMTDARPVTPQGLMSHTSGLGDAFGFPGYEPDEPLPTVIEILEGGERSNVGRIFMEREPGTAYEYSGGGVTLQQLVLTDVRDRPFEEILRTDVLDPIGMTRSTFEQPLPPAWDANAARAHSGQGESMGPKWHVYPEQAAAGLWTTATDLSRFAIEVQRSLRGASNRVLDVAHARRMITPVGVGPFAIGFSITKDGEGWYFQHSGGNWGFISNLVAHVSKGYGYAVMTNSGSGGRLVGELDRRIKRVYGWDALAQPVPRGYRPMPELEPIEVDRAILERYVGRYEGAENVTVTLGDDGLLAAVDGAGTFPMFASSETEFFLQVAPVTMEFLLEGDAVTGIFLTDPSGRESTLERVPGRDPEPRPVTPR